MPVSAAVIIPAAIAAAQIGVSTWKLIQSNKARKAAATNQEQGPADNTASKYENIYSSMADNIATKSLAVTEKKIDQNRINTVELSSQVFKDPILRSRASTLASSKANEDYLDASLRSERERAGYVGSAERAGLSQRNYNNRLWSQMMGRRDVATKRFDRAQAAWGGALNAGIHNVSGAIDSYLEDKEMDDMRNEDVNEDNVADDYGNNDISEEQTIEDSEQYFRETAGYKR